MNVISATALIFSLDWGANMSYIDELFTRYGSPSKEADIKIWGWLKRPDTCASFDDVRSYDDKVLHWQ